MDRTDTQTRNPPGDRPGGYPRGSEKGTYRKFIKRILCVCLRYWRIPPEGSRRIPTVDPTDTQTRNPPGDRPGGYAGKLAFFHISGHTINPGQRSTLNCCLAQDAAALSVPRPMGDQGRSTALDVIDLVSDTVKNKIHRGSFHRP